MSTGQGRGVQVRCRLQILLPAAFISASAGVVTGLYLAAREIRAQQYLGQGLWRTALWLASRDSMLGAAVGAMAGALMIVSLLSLRTSLPLYQSSRPSADPRASTVPAGERWLHLVLRFSAAVCLAAILMPANAANALRIPYWFAAAVPLLLLWLIVRSAAVPDDLAGDRPGAWFEVVWPLGVFLAYIVGLAHFWAVVEAEWWTLALSAAGLLLALAIYSFLFGRAQRLCARLGGIVALSKQLPHPRWLSTAVLACAIALWTSAWVVGARARSSARAAGPNVIIIAVDTLREDEVSWLAEDEHDHDLTPNLRGLLAPRGTVFSHAYSQAPWTLPAFASIFTGLYPEQHGADRKSSQLLPEQLTLAEILREAGYLTMAVVSGPYVGSDAGMMQGFTLRDESQVPGGSAITSQEVTDRALAFLTSHRDDRFLLFAHYFDPHYLYQDHVEFDLASLRGHQFPPGDARTLLWRRPSQFPKARPVYDEEIAYADLHIGRLLTFLDGNDLWASTCVVFVSDHGEEFLEHGSAGHAHTLYQELVHVPLLVADPASDTPSIIDDLVETRWLFGTILDILNIRRPDGGVSDHTLFERPQDEDYDVRSSVHSDAVGRDWLSCLIGKQYKLIKHHGDGRAVLYDLVSDPGETHDLSAERPDSARQHLAALEALDAELSTLSERSPVPRLSDTQLRRLKGLGYL